MTKGDMNSNEIITKWLGRCWHELREDVPENALQTSCVKCGEWIDPQTPNIPFTTPSGFFDLLAGLKEKWVVAKMFRGIASKPHVELKTMHAMYSPQIKVDATADTLPEALIAAVLKLIESDTGEEEKG